MVNPSTRRVILSSWTISIFFLFQLFTESSTSSLTLHNRLLFSALIGLPKSIRFAECDTKGPSNLYDDELFEDMKVLPPSRPVTEPTPFCYQIVKYHIMRAYGYVVEFLHILEPQPYTEVIKLDAQLKETRDAIPPHLQLGTLEEMRHDRSATVMEKYILQIFYYKATIILHRKYFQV